MSKSSTHVPVDYPARVKSLRERLSLTQTRFAERIGVSFATVNRWENNQSRPTRLAWQKILDIEEENGLRDGNVAYALSAPETPSLDFGAPPDAVVAIAEAMRLACGHLSNPAFATEISSIDPLPHQRIAVYEHMLDMSPLRFLLADDAGAGKTIMTGLYLREVFARQLIKRVLIVPPAGLVGNWERELRTLFRLSFRIVRGADARTENPFVGPDSDRLIVSLDTLAGERMFDRMREAVASGAATPYDLVVFDEAHKLSADRERNFYVRKTDRYRLAEVLAGLPADKPQWELGWSAAHILLLTATPHMGKDFPYYCLWRLLAPEALSTFGAFEAFPETQRRRYFIRRTKEEMVRFDGKPLYPQRQCDTLSYALSPDEQRLYNATTKYIDKTYNKAETLNRSAARLAMSVFQRRLASSTYALMRSFERRLERLDEAIDLVRAGQENKLERLQKKIDRTDDFFERYAADEDADENGERHEEFESTALGGVAASGLEDLRDERAEVEALLAQARRLADAGEDSKFEKLRAVFRDKRFSGEKFIVFTEHRDTATFLVRRLEGLGFAGQVASIHGGLDYRQREAQVELFRRFSEEGGANYLIATDAAGEGINLQFCWLMANYDIPWNPARLEQRMGRIHRYGQMHDPVVIVNLIAGQTREGRVMETLLNKMETIRTRLRSDKVFDVIGRLFQGVSLKAYLEKAVTEDGAQDAIEEINGLLTEEQVRAIIERDRASHGGGDVKGRLPALNAVMEREQYRRLLPGYVRGFVQSAAPLIDLDVKGDLDDIFEFVPKRSRALDPLLGEMDIYPHDAQGRFTVYREKGHSDSIWLHPGEPVFDCFLQLLMSRYGDTARRGAIFVDPHAEVPYLFHLAWVSVMRQIPRPVAEGLFDATEGRTEMSNTGPHIELVERRLIGLRQESDGTITSCPLERLLMLHSAPDAAPGSISLARRARGLTETVLDWLRGDVCAGMVEEYRARIEHTVPDRMNWIARGYDYRAAELAAKRNKLRDRMREDDPDAKTEFAQVRAEQQKMNREKEQHLELIRKEPSLIVPGDVEMIVHALIIPTDDPEERRRHDANVEQIAMQVAQAHEEAAGATVYDVSNPQGARRAGLQDWPGFDLQSFRPARGDRAAEERAIEVKGRARTGGVQLQENEWRKACTLGKGYWLYVVLDCDTPQPRLLRIRDPFGAFVVGKREISSYTISARSLRDAAE